MRVTPRLPQAVEASHQAEQRYLVECPNEHELELTKGFVSPNSRQGSRGNMLLVAPAGVERF